MATVTVKNLTLRFPVYGADNRSLKKHLARVSVGGVIGKDSHRAPVVTALSNINMKLRPGDRVALIGHNGSGKTTFLRALSGAYEPDEGTIEVSGRIAALLDLGLGIDPSATGYDNIRLRGLVAGLTRKEIDDKLESIAGFTGLGGFLSMPLKTYSAGMQARLAFAVATSVDADVLLLDEWIAVGDAKFREAAHERLLDLVERARILVLASHDVSLVKYYCNKVVRFDGGVASKIHPIEDLEELLALPSGEPAVA
jgi:lipopolysaccharide transport system ATP-binding protein